MNHEVVVIIGVGGIGQAIARRQGAGKLLLLADFNQDTLASAHRNLETLGYTVKTQVVDVSSRDAVKALAETATRLGNVMQVITTAGLSPNMAPAKSILAVDLLGVALVLEEFRNVVSAGGAGIVISSMAGHMLPPLTADQNKALADTPTDDLLELAFLSNDAISDSGMAYAMAKRANHLRVQVESIHWGQRGARVNAISPGIIATPLAQHEMNSPVGHIYRAMIDASSSKRMGTPDEVATAAAYLLGNDASFITGADLLIDGGVIAAMRGGRINLELDTSKSQ